MDWAAYTSQTNATAICANESACQLTTSNNVDGERTVEIPSSFYAFHAISAKALQQLRIDAYVERPGNYFMIGTGEKGRGWDLPHRPRVMRWIDGAGHEVIVTR